MGNGGCLLLLMRDGTLLVSWLPLSGVHTSCVADGMHPTLVGQSTRHDAAIQSKLIEPMQCIKQMMH
jgi:hypothetical protein